MCGPTTPCSSLLEGSTTLHCLLRRLATDWAASGRSRRALFSSQVRGPLPPGRVGVGHTLLDVRDDRSQLRAVRNVVPQLHVPVVERWLVGRRGRAGAGLPTLHVYRLVLCAMREDADRGVARVTRLAYG